MLLAIPTAGGRLCMHFGHCEQFALVDSSASAPEAAQVKMVDPPAHEPGLLPRWLHEQGVDVIIAGGMGQRAQALFAQNGIQVVVGAPSETPENLAAAFHAGTLTCGENTCDH